MKSPTVKMWLPILLLGAVQALAAQEVRQIRIEEKSDCAAGEECPERRTRVFFLGPEGERRLVEGGEHSVWVSGDDLSRVVLMGGDFGRGYLGVELTELTPELRLHFGVPEDEGVMVSRVVEDSPAERAGIEVGDIVAQVDGRVVASGMALSKTIGEREPGETVALQVWRDGGVLSLTSEVGERPEPATGFRFRSGDRDCAEGEDCRRELVIERRKVDRNVRMVCDDGDCSCTVDGEPRDCDEIEGLPRPD